MTGDDWGAAVIYVALIVLVVCLLRKWRCDAVARTDADTLALEEVEKLYKADAPPRAHDDCDAALFHEPDASHLVTPLPECGVDHRYEKGQKTTQPRCETCKHWSRDERVINDDGTGTCARGAGVWAGPKGGDTLAYAADYEGYKAALVTKPNFGCVMYESRADVALPEAVARRVNAAWTWEAGEND